MAPVAENPSEFIIRLQGDVEQLDIETLVRTLSSVSGLVEEAAVVLAPGAPLRLKVRAPRKGSFILDLSLLPGGLAESIEGLFNVEALKAAGGVLSAVVAFFKIRQFLKKEPPAKAVPVDHGVQLTNSSGNTIVVDNRTFNVYQDNRTVNEYLNRTFDALDADSKVETFELCSPDDSPLFIASRDEFGELAAAPLAEAEEGERVEVSRATLHIVKVSFEPRRRWNFIHQGVPIGAYIRDPVFLAEVENRRQAFLKGDTLEVDLQVRRVFDRAIGTWVNRDYEVLRVYEHHHAQQQLSIQPPRREA